jgi:hypothetical protein
MKKFLINTIAFCLFSIGLTLAIETVTDYVIRKKANFKIGDQNEYIVIGHSHAACAFNDSLIANFKNMAGSGESYFYTFFKTKQLLEQNPNIHTIFIEFSNNQVSNRMDEWIWGDMYMTERLPTYSPFLQFSDYKILLENNFKGSRNASALSLKKKIQRIVKRDFDYSEVGGYRYSTDEHVDSLLLNRSSAPSLKNTDSISEVNLEYLSKIIEFCKQHKKKIILLRSPLHVKYEGYANENKYKEILNTRFKNLEYIDCSRFPLENSEFGDLGHLNFKGAKKFSTWFQKEIIPALGTKKL